MHVQASSFFFKEFTLRSDLPHFNCCVVIFLSMIITTACMREVHGARAWIIDHYTSYITVWDIMTKYLFPFLIWWQIFPGLILSDIKPAKKMKFKTVCYLLVQLMHCRKMFKAEIPFSNAMNCEDGDKVLKSVSVLTCLCLYLWFSKRCCIRFSV